MDNHFNVIWMVAGMLLGMAIGCVIGIYQGRVGTSMCFGLAFGMIIGIGTGAVIKKFKGEKYNKFPVVGSFPYQTIKNGIASGYAIAAHLPPLGSSRSSDFL